MSRELIEFSNLIDEQFEPDNSITDELWMTLQSWFSQPAKMPYLNPLKVDGLEDNYARQAS
jgi:hypothetical protein